jgi:hypothetical protein
MLAGRKIAMSYPSVVINGDNCWPELKDNFIEGKWVGIAHRKQGTARGKPTVAVRIELPDGQTVLAQTTLEFLSTAIRAFEVAP